LALTCHTTATLVTQGLLFNNMGHRHNDILESGTGFAFLSLIYHPQPLFRHHPSFARQNKKSSTKTHQLHLHESQPKYIATQKKLPLLIIKMIGCDDSDLIRLCGVRDLCMLCYGNVISLIAKILTALCLVFWSLSLTTT
jgi:hypothetical protein